jgi:hypothetical protein
MKKNFKKKTLVGLAIIGVSVLIIWIGPLAPSKELVVITKQMPKLDGSERTSITYSVYYIWDDMQEEHPWWVIFQAPLGDGDFEWAVLEVADVGDVYDTDKFMKAMQFASKFDKNWFKSEMYRVQRTRLEKLQHILFGSDALEKEEEVIGQILNSIGLAKK